MRNVSTAQQSGRRRWRWESLWCWRARPASLSAAAQLVALTFQWMNARGTGLGGRNTSPLSSRKLAAGVVQVFTTTKTKNTAYSGRPNGRIFFIGSSVDEMEGTQPAAQF